MLWVMCVKPTANCFGPVRDAARAGAASFCDDVGERAHQAASPSTAACSAAVRRGALKRERAQSRESPHLYIARGPKSRYGGPPPRLAIVVNVSAATGKPASVSAAAASL